MSSNIKVTINAPTQEGVLATDSPIGFNVHLSGHDDVPIPISGVWEANFGPVIDGTYTGSVDAIRADGTVINNISFTATAPAPVPTPATVSAPVLAGVSVSVTPVA